MQGICGMQGRYVGADKAGRCITGPTPPQPFARLYRGTERSVILLSTAIEKSAVL